MKKEVRLVFGICAAAIIGIILIQLFWLQRFYEMNRDRFEKDVNLAFEDAIKKELAIRNDSIELLMYRFLMDTTQIKISSQWNHRFNTQVYYIINAKDSNDKYSFSNKGYSFPIRSQADTNISKIARLSARLNRVEDVDRHIVFYRTQNFGTYIREQTENLGFDTSRLRTVFLQMLAEREIYDPFVFVLKDDDNTLNRNKFPDSIRNEYPVITKAFPTYKNVKDQNFARALFKEPKNYMFTKTRGVIVNCVLLLLVVIGAFMYLIRVIRKEKKLSAIKNDFINHITHEFKTPIATVYSAVQALDDFNLSEDPVKTKKFLRISKNELERLSGLVTKVLNLSLYEQADHSFRKEKINLDQIIREIIDAQGNSAANKIHIRYQNRSNYPIILGDSAHIYNSINNLIDNAIRYSDKEISITVTLYETNRNLMVEVCDRGIGIHKEHLNFVFDKFYRAPDSSTLSKKGFGLGLSYTKQVIENHKGWCSVKSEYGEGSTFTICLPLENEK